MVNEIDITEDKAKWDVGLPPAGHARDEVLRERTDKLAEQAETQTPDTGRIPHDHDALNPERNREIRYAISENYLEIGVNHPYLKTKWVNYVNLNGQKIWEAKADGWKVATIQDFPEARDLAREDNTIRVGDVILMCIRLDEHVKLMERERNKRLRQQYGIEAEIHDLASRNPNAFAGAVTPMIGTTGNPSPNVGRALASMEKRANAVSTAARHLGNRMKQGTIPGVPLPGQKGGA